MFGVLFVQVRFSADVKHKALSFIRTKAKKMALICAIFVSPISKAIDIIYNRISTKYWLLCRMLPVDSYVFCPS